MKGKRVLVTGGCGAIGSNLVARLLEDNTVTVLDCDGALPSHERLKYVRNLITDRVALSDLFRENKFDVVFHLAASFANERSVEDPMLDLSVNLDGTVYLLEECRKHDVKRFVYASSSSCYGQVEGPCKESTKLFPSTPYAVSKLGGEQYTMVYMLFRTPMGLRSPERPISKFMED